MANTSKFSMSAILSLVDNMSGPYKKTTIKITALNKSMGGSFGKLNASIDNTAKMIGKGLVGSVGLATTGIGLLVKEASKIEDVQASFTPMLGSVERANKLVEMLNQTAATTPFQLENIAESATQLLPAMNGDLENTVKTFRMLGDTAGGNAEKLSRISAVYSRVLLKNKLETGDLNILTERGIPIYAELSKSMGVTIAEMSKMASQGKITGADLTKAFENMTQEGGVFFRGMEIASETFTGRLSTLKDNIALTGATLGQIFLPKVKEVIMQLTTVAQKVRSWAEANQDLLLEKMDNMIRNLTEGFNNAKPAIRDVVSVMKMMVETSMKVASFIVKNKSLIEGFIITLVSFKVAILAVTAAQKIQIAAMALGPVLSFIKVMASLAKTEGLLATAQLALNMAMSANPIGLIIVGVTALIGLGILLVKNWKKVGPVFEMLGRTIMSALLFPVNLVIEAIQILLSVVSKIPGVGDKLKPAIDQLQKFQDGMNSVTIQGKQKQVAEDRQQSIERAQQEKAMIQDIENEKRFRQQEVAQRNDIFLHGPVGSGISDTPGGAPSTSIKLGVQ